MKKEFYAKLALNGIKKNKQLYVPYFLAGIAMVMVFYVFLFLSRSTVVQQLPGRETLPFLFDFGAKSIGLFSIPFLFYTNSSLIKKRKKELGLYQVLGMNQTNLFLVLCCENLITYGIVIIGGILSGIVFSKLAELGLIHIMDGEVNYRVTIDGVALGMAFFIYALIYGVILLNALWQMKKSNPIALLHSEMEGEKPPKSGWILAVTSIFLLGIAYFIICSLDMPMDMNQAFLGIGLITVGTFFFFICTSVYLCEFLQKQKGYYYQTSHFVTVSSMKFRMKRSGASLAAICVLTTMILATFSFSAAFYISSADVIQRHYPYDCGISVAIPVDNMEEELENGGYTGSIRDRLQELEEINEDFVSMEAYSANFMAVMQDGVLDLGIDMRDTWFTPGFYNSWEEGDQKIVYVHVMDLDTYNRLCKSKEVLADGEILMASRAVHYREDDIQFSTEDKWHIAKKVKRVPPMIEVRIEGDSMDAHGCDQIFLIVSDLYDFMGRLKDYDRIHESHYLDYHWEWNVEWNGSKASLQKFYDEAVKCVQDRLVEEEGADIRYYLKMEKGENFYALAGGLLFVAILVNVLFLFVTALIMYYKQLSEGYEDQKRFRIMRKVGMTQREIQKSVQSQMKLVFALPLVVAGIHFIFTTNILYSMLRMGVIDNKGLLIRVMMVSYLVYACVYSLVYLLTSKTYLRVVSR